MDENRAVELLNKALRCMQTDPRDCEAQCKKCKNYAAKEDGIEAIRTAIKALGKDINVHSKSALDHIHNVVKDDAYKRGYEQGKADASPKWIPLKAHPATEEERESRPDIDYWFDCEMPDDEQEILVTVKHKNWTGVEKDVCYVEDSYGLDSGHGWLDDVIAWMPLPEPYKEGEWKC